MNTEEEALIAALDSHDALVRRCAGSDMPYEEFEREYDCFFQRWALDGHESEPDAQLLVRYADRIRLHQRVWDEVITRATSEALARRPDSQQAGFIGPEEARMRLRSIAAEAGLLVRDA